MKFGDIDELSSADLANALWTMSKRGKFKELLLMLDTCQAASMTSDIQDTPRVISLSAAGLGENSFALNVDRALGVSTIDRFTGSVLNFLTRNMAEGVTLRDMYETLHPRQLYSHAALEGHNFTGDAGSVALQDFFANSVSPTPRRLTLPSSTPWNGVTSLSSHSKVDDADSPTSAAPCPQRVHLGKSTRWRSERFQHKEAPSPDRDAATLVVNGVIGLLVLLVAFGAIAGVAMP
jgi:phosphatidylinositol glycan class K